MDKKEGTEDSSGGGINIPDVLLPLREFVKGQMPNDSRVHLAALVGLGLLCAFLFANILSSDFSAMQKALMSAALFILSGEIARAFTGWDGFWGLILFRDKSTLAWIDRQAKRYSRLWVALADLGLVVGYGLSSWFLFGNECKKNTWRLLCVYAGGFSVLFLFSAIAAPLAIPLIMGMVSGGGNLAAASGHVREAIPSESVFSANVFGVEIGASAFSLIMFFALVLFGLAGSVFASILTYAVVILPALVGSIVSYAASVFGMGKFDAGAIPSPGGEPILPGVNLPFVEGILALAILLVVHEASHGLLARIAGVKLDSAGMVFFGILPFGAFVEPDEKEMKEIGRHEENRILVAGSASNIIFAILSFFALTGLVFMTSDLRLEGYKVVGGNLPAGVIVQEIAGQKYTGQNLSLKANTTVSIITDEGAFERTTNSDGKIGINMAWVYKSGLGFDYKYAPGFRWIEFLLNVLGLTFALNVLVGIVNLLPLPLFDGGKLMANGVRNEKAALAISALAAGAFAVNLLPWIFK
ncbi:MAG: site-2 protease family protein [Candidatus Micrarchaeota archaeon]